LSSSLKNNYHSLTKTITFLLSILWISCSGQGLAILAIFAVFLSGCRAQVATEHPAVLVAAAADLTKVSRPLARAFEQSTGLRVTFGFASSAQLEQQIRRGAYFDVYMPAARSFCQSLERDGFTAGSDQPFALGRLVAWSKTVQLNSLRELTDSKVRRIAIANPRLAPYGKAAEEALEKAGLWTAIQPKLVYGESVAHALQMAETGNAEVAFVALALLEDRKATFYPVDPGLYTPLEQAAVVLKDSTNKPDARAFVAFLTSAEARRILEEYGFGHL
jgi:molybdate transport system substrate-binding protein